MKLGSVWLIRIITVLCFLGATISLGAALRIQVKAALAQALIASSWAASVPFAKPWPWADTWPVGLLEIGSHQLYVLAGAHGSALAFGPGHMDGTALPGEIGTSVIAGHRDTHFALLAQIQSGDQFRVQSAAKRWSSYRVQSIEIVDTRITPTLSVVSDNNVLLLITCYPFDAIDPGGPLRYVVTAMRVGDEIATEL